MSQYGAQPSHEQGDFAPQDQPYAGEAGQAQDLTQNDQYDEQGQQDPLQHEQQNPSMQQGGEPQAEEAQDASPQDAPEEIPQSQQQSQPQSAVDQSQPNGLPIQQSSPQEQHPPQKQSKQQPQNAGSPNLGPKAQGQGQIPQPQSNNQIQPSQPIQAQQHPQQQKPQWGTGRSYHKTHHNALYHMSQSANNGFTKEHMDSFLHLGVYALGALSNQHGLAPDAMHPETEGLQR